MNTYNDKILDEIAKCEEVYRRCFCKVEEQEVCTIYRDELLLDMYEHNFTLLKENMSLLQLQDWVKRETKIALEQKADFYKLRMKYLPKEDILSSQNKRAEKETLGIYLCDIEKAKGWKETKGCNIKLVRTMAQVEELLELDLIHDRETYGEDFCNRRARRRGNIYLADSPCNSYILYCEGKPVGNCELFIEGEVAKIEEFAVLPMYQRKGIGTTLLKEMVLNAQNQGARTIYLNADEADTPKEMYVKLGFQKLGELYSLFWKL